MHSPHSLKLSLPVFLCIILLFTTACQKDENLKTPMITTGDIEIINHREAIVYGHVLDAGGAAILAKGVCWAMGEVPTTSHCKTDEGGGDGSFYSQLTDLIPNATYYVRAYATNKYGTSYGNLISFETPPGNIVNFLAEDGFPVAGTEALAVDQQNNLWIGTAEGLSMFDGDTWTSYTTEQGLPSGFISALTISPDGTIWMGTRENGLIKFDGNQFTHYTTADGLYSDRIYSLEVDQQQNLWVGTGNNRLTRFDGVGFENTHINPQAAGPGGHIHGIAIDTQGQIWAGSCISGLSVYTQGTWTNFVNNLNVFVRVLFSASNGDIWVSHLPTGIYRFASGQWTYFNNPDATWLNFVYSFAESHDGTIWIGGSNGISYLENHSWVNLFTQDGLPEHAILALVTDQNGDIWAGGSQGISRITK